MKTWRGGRVLRKRLLVRSGNTSSNTLMDLGDALSGGRDVEAAADISESPPSGTWTVYRLIA